MATCLHYDAGNDSVIFHDLLLHAGFHAEEINYQQCSMIESENYEMDENCGMQIDLPYGMWKIQMLC